MGNRDSTEYYAARERRERELAAGSVDTAVAAIHLDLAERYALLLWPKHTIHEVGKQQHIHAEG